MGARAWVKACFGEKTARIIERMAAVLLGDSVFVECRKCRTQAPANVVREWGCCPVCHTPADVGDERFLRHGDAGAGDHEG
jgi:hypothetical protein